MINGEGGRYKLKFYGIMSNQCLQMTTSISCANRCTFCWRGYKAPVSKEWGWDVDDPTMILEESKKAHHKLLVGFGGSDKANKASYEKSKSVRHVALSLTGEPITYPRINELIEQFHARQISTFLVTNSQYPEQIRDLKPITQLYCGVDAPTKEMLKEVDKPLFPNYWERIFAKFGLSSAEKAKDLYPPYHDQRCQHDLSREIRRISPAGKPGFHRSESIHARRTFATKAKQGKYAA